LMNRRTLASSTEHGAGYVANKRVEEGYERWSRYAEYSPQYSEHLNWRGSPSSSSRVWAMDITGNTDVSACRWGFVLIFDVESRTHSWALDLLNNWAGTGTFFDFGSRRTSAIAASIVCWWSYILEKLLRRPKRDSLTEHFVESWFR
jgi:hypothetical protein